MVVKKSLVKNVEKVELLYHRTGYDSLLWQSQDSTRGSCHVEMMFF
jgi:hypothetical protein